MRSKTVGLTGWQPKRLAALMFQSEHEDADLLHIFPVHFNLITGALTNRIHNMHIKVYCLAAPYFGLNWSFSGTLSSNANQRP
jgi:hypothetical protein